MSDAEATLVKEEWTVMTIEEVEAIRAQEAGDLQQSDASIVKRVPAARARATTSGFQ